MSALVPYTHERSLYINNMMVSLTATVGSFTSEQIKLHAKILLRQNTVYMLLMQRIHISNVIIIISEIHNVIHKKKLGTQLVPILEILKYYFGSSSFDLVLEFGFTSFSLCDPIFQLCDLQN